ncbi:hypothetical protein FOL47_010142 [Perkinsus chesapeaki]|uniref:Uncharacterized protein n=1 Tax=Perkinsus chesapeaki TaxID=330153 RepID=A0A7J6MQA4_PERCH|nr:hypothetical protein FOL47_010142 [Perkinsus chesapeaki]
MKVTLAYFALSILEIFGAPSPPSGNYFKRLNSVVCVETEWIYGTAMEAIGLKVKCDTVTRSSVKLGLNSPGPDEFEVAGGSDKKHVLFVELVNKACSRILKMDTFDLYSFKYDREIDEISTDFLNAEIVLTKEQRSTGNPGVLGYRYFSALKCLCGTRIVSEHQIPRHRHAVV